MRNLERAGVPRSVAMKLTGYLTESVYRRYAIVSEGDLTEATRRTRGPLLAKHLLVRKTRVGRASACMRDRSETSRPTTNYTA